VNGTVREVDQLLGMTDREEGVATLVAGIGRRSGVTLLQRCRQCGITDDARPSAVADGLKLSVPVVCRQPHLDLDVRIGRWREHRLHAAMRRQHHGRRAARSLPSTTRCAPPSGVACRSCNRSTWRTSLCRRRERPRRYELCRRDGGIGQRKRCELLARRRSSLGTQQHDGQRCNHARYIHSGNHAVKNGVD
jgi:hypothetical protein